MCEEGLFQLGRRYAWYAVFVAILPILSPQRVSASTSVTLAWDASTDASVTEYRVYYGVASGSYTNALSAGAATTATVPGLAGGTKYFFAATALDSMGQESDYSSETSYIPATSSNQPPTISSIANQITSQDTAISGIPFTIGDLETAASSLTVSGSSGNPSLIPQANLVFGGSGANRTVTITPAAGQNGNASITVTVSDGTSTATSSFQLSVTSPRPANTPPAISAIADQLVQQDTASAPIAFTISDKETAATSLTLSGSSSDQSIVPNANIVFAGVGKNRTVTIIPATGMLGSATISITVSDGNATTNISFLVSVEENAFTPAVTSYSGLFYESDQVRLDTAGSFKITTTAKKTYSGKVNYKGRAYSITGRLDAQGRGSNSIPRRAQTPLTLTFDCGASNSLGMVIGTLANSDWAASLSGDRAVFNSRTNPAPWAGMYTLVLPGQTNDVSSPKGHSYGSVRVDKGGRVSVSGSLADGTHFSQSAPLSRAGMWPFHASLYSSQGLVLSWLAVTNETGANPDIAGLASWVKLTNPRGHYYPGGFTNECNAAGCAYLRPTNTTEHVVGLNHAKMKFSGGNLPEDFTNSVALGISSKIINESPNALSMTFSLTTGTFNGRVLDPGTGKTKTFHGAILQRFDAGYGTLLGTNLSSRVEFVP
jgi:hypothetical protein